MKLSLVVSQGVHSGKVIPIASTKFSIGRDPSCQLRPASPAVSKTHCTITVENGAVFIEDNGSTNGTLVNGTRIERKTQLNHGDHLKVGPLEFNLNVVVAEAASVQAPPAKAAEKVAEPAQAPSRLAPTIHGEDPDVIAAMLLADDDGSAATIEAHAMDSTTVMEIPALLGDTKPTTKKTEPKKEEKSATSAAAEALSMYMRGSRPSQQKPPAGGKK